MKTPSKVLLCTAGILALVVAVIANLCAWAEGVVAGCAVSGGTVFLLVVAAMGWEDLS